MKRTAFLLACIVATLILGTSTLAAETSDTSMIRGVDTTSVILVGSTLLALVLGAISLIAYRRDGRQKLLFITAAFGFFALKGVLLLTSDFLALQQPYLDVVASLLDFIVLLCFFAGVLKK